MFSVLKCCIFFVFLCLSFCVAELNITTCLEAGFSYCPGLKSCLSATLFEKMTIYKAIETCTNLSEDLEFRIIQHSEIFYGIQPCINEIYEGKITLENKKFWDAPVPIEEICYYVIYKFDADKKKVIDFTKLEASQCGTEEFPFFCAAF